MPSQTSKQLQIEEYSSEIEASEGAVEGPLILAIPGIRTSADWVNSARIGARSWQNPPDVRVVSGQSLRSLDLMTRWNLNSAALLVRSQLEDMIEQNPQRRISVICHSMGCDVFRRSIQNVDYKFDLIVFVGSVCHRRYSKSISSKCKKFINDRGRYDLWPVVAKWVCPPAFGDTGTFGFRNAHVIDRIFDNDHGTCTNPEHINNFVFPVIMGQIIEETISDPSGGIDHNVSRYVGYAVSVLKILFFSVLFYFMLIFLF